MRKHALCTWGVDKASGVERYSTQLKEWAAEALLRISESIEEEDHGAIDRQGCLISEADLSKTLNLKNRNWISSEERKGCLT